MKTGQKQLQQNAAPYSQALLYETRLLHNETAIEGCLECIDMANVVHSSVSVSSALRVGGTPVGKRRDALPWSILKTHLFAHDLCLELDKNRHIPKKFTSMAALTVAHVCWRLGNDPVVRRDLAKKVWPQKEHFHEKRREFDEHKNAWLEENNLKEWVFENEEIGEEQREEKRPGEKQLKNEKLELDKIKDSIIVVRSKPESTDHAISIVAFTLVSDGVSDAFRRLAGATAGKKKWYQLAPARIAWAVYTSPLGPGYVPLNPAALARLPGSRLPVPGRRTGHDFATVRLHESAASDALARRIEEVVLSWCPPSRVAIQPEELRKRARYWAGMALGQLEGWLGSEDRDAHGRGDTPW